MASVVLLSEFLMGRIDRGGDPSRSPTMSPLGMSENDCAGGRCCRILFFSYFLDLPPDGTW